MSKKYGLLLISLLVSTILFSQNEPDSLAQKDSTQRNLTTKQKRKYQDSLAKNLAPIDGKAIVYIVRPGIMAFAIPFRLDCDSFLVGWIAAKTYLYTIVDTGEHVFKAQSENESDLKITVESGKIYFLEQESRMGVMYARTKLKILKDEAGRKDLSKCTLSKHNRYPEVVLAKDHGQTPSE